MRSIKDPYNDRSRMGKDVEKGMKRGEETENLF